jgi:PAS domain S-box-containing protein
MGDTMKDDNKTKKQLVHELTELRLQKAALKKSVSEEKYRSLVENLRDVIYELDSQGVVLYISPTIRDLLGYDSTEIVGKNFIELAHKDDLSSRAEWFSELRKGVESPSEYRILNKSGELRWARTNTRPIMEDGLFKGARGILIDVTAQRRTEEALRILAARNEAILAAVPDIIMEVDVCKRYTWANQAGMRFFGDDVIGREASYYFVGEQETYNNARPLFNGGEDVIYIESCQRRQDGEKRLLSWWCKVLKNEQGLVIGALSTGRDITDRKGAEEEQRRMNTFLDSVIENIPNMIFLKDARHLRFVRFNRAGEDLLGYSRNDLLGKSDYDFFPKDQADFFTKKDWEVLQGKEVVDIPEELLQTRNKGERTMHTKKVPILNVNGEPEYLLGISEDITEQKRAEEKLQHTLDSLRKAVSTTIQAMVSTVEARDPYTAGHQIRSADLARAIATEMELSQEKIEGIRMVGSIHDIGKISIPAEILSKPTKLSEIEFSLIKEHARKGYEMLKDVESPWPLAEIVYQHHERMDGSGYPRNMKGEDICVEARILAVADVVEAMASHRPYRPGLGIDAALSEIEKNKGIFYDVTVADACLKLFREKGFQFVEA